jgi:hypothetical protein
MATSKGLTGDMKQLADDLAAALADRLSTTVGSIERRAMALSIFECEDYKCDSSFRCTDYKCSGGGFKCNGKFSIGPAEFGGAIGPAA